MKTKTFQAPIELKADGQHGEFSAIFSTFNVIDHDGDVTVPSAFQEGQAVRVSYWGHRWHDLPVGRGVIHHDDEKAWIDGQFFMDTEAGRETYLTVKNLGDLQEWSYGFDILESSMGQFADQDVQFLESLDVHEVSPVMRGAGVGTGTTDIKEKKAAIGAHSTSTVDSAWDGPANKARLRNDGTAAYYRRAFAWADPEGDPETKAAYKFIHHMVDGEGNIGAANVRGCIAGIAVLNGGRGGTTIPDADRRGVYNHLARHLRDADMEPPELKSLEQADEDEGEDSEDVKPSVTSPDVIRTQIDILEIEE